MVCLNYELPGNTLEVNFVSLACCCMFVILLYDAFTQNRQNENSTIKQIFWKVGLAWGICSTAELYSDTQIEEFDRLEYCSGYLWGGY